MNLAPILDDCLQRLQSGETLAGCLARYPDHAADLAPMLAVAAQVSALAGQAPSTEQRQRALARLRQAGADQRSRQRSRPAAGWRMPLFAARRLAVVAALALLLLTALSAGVIAASQPGQPAYELRVIVERVPALAALDPAARAEVELDTADRRLSDLQGHLERTGQAQPAALRAMLAGDQAAARQAERAGDEARGQVAARLAERARRLAALADSAPDPAAAQDLALAAHNTWRLAEQLQAGPPDQTPLQPPAAGTATPTSTATASPTASPAPSDETPTPTPGATPTPPRPTPDPQSTAQPQPSRTPASQGQTPPAASQTPPRQTVTAPAQPPTAAGTPSPHQTSRPEQTAMAQTATAQAPTATPMPSATATPQVDPEPTSTAMSEPTRPTPPRPGPGHTPPRP